MKLLLLDRKSTRLNSSHVEISYAVFCLKKKEKEDIVQGCAELRGVRDPRAAVRHPPTSSTPCDAVCSSVCSSAICALFLYLFFYMNRPPQNPPPSPPPAFSG